MRIKYTALLPLVLMFSTISICQVASVNYILDYNCERNLYEVSIHIKKGQAKEAIDRLQFNCQIACAVPAGSAVKIVEMYAPLKDNQKFDGTDPLIWYINKPIKTPEGIPHLDFYSIVPTLGPSSFYNVLNEDDEILLFSFSVGNETTYNSQVRLFDNEKDPAKSLFKGVDLRNGFTLGKSEDIYSDNIHRKCGVKIE